MKTIVFVSIIIYFSLALEVRAQKVYPPVIDGAKEVTYKKVGETELKLWIFNPSKHKPTMKTPVIVFYFGGGWNGGSPSQFVEHCKYLAARGMVAMVADYRVKSRNNVKANKCVSDAKSAVRWIREHAGELGVDPNRIAAGGGSAGGHLAAATATLPQFDEENENLEISSKPNALVLFNPALVLAPIGEGAPEENERFKNLEARMGAKPETMSPYHNVGKNMPPTIIFHGTGDTTVPFKTVELFRQKMKENGNTCTLVAYENEAHGFFNYGKKSNGAFIDSVNKMDKFLVSLGYLKAPPAVSVYK